MSFTGIAENLKSWSESNDYHLILNGTRTYDPYTGIFLTEDPIEFEAGDTNLRRYVGNDPVNKTDPSGLDAYDLWAIAENVFRTGWNTVMVNPSFQLDYVTGDEMKGMTANTGQGALNIANGATELPNTASNVLAEVINTNVPNSPFSNLDFIPPNPWSKDIIKPQTPEEHKRDVNLAQEEIAKVGAAIIVPELALELAPDCLAVRVTCEAMGAGNKAANNIKANKLAGDKVRDTIAAREAPALTEQRFRTVGGDRIVDVLKIGDKKIAIESKVGRTSLGTRERQELARDWWLRRQRQVDELRWEFSPSDVNGGVGPTQPLLEKLNKLKVGVKINE